MYNDKCRYSRIGGDWFEYCEPEKKANNETDIEKGSAWGWFVCAILSCSNYTQGYEYDWYEDKCACKGKWISPSLWRR